MEIIRDLLWLWILGALGGSGYIVYALYVRDGRPALARGSGQITTRRTPAAVPPIAKPAPIQRTTPPAAPAEHQRRGSAPTVKLQAADPATRSADDAAAADLFGGLGAAKAKADAAPALDLPKPASLAPPKDIVEKALRLEERGFHVGSTKATPPAEPTPSAAVVIVPPAVAPAPSAPAAAPTAPPAAEAVPGGQARSQTQELDDILKRIDAVLAESGPGSSEATLTSGHQADNSQATMPMPTQPPTERHERKGTDPNQQKLF